MRFLMVDRILELEPEKRAMGVKNITMSEDFLTHHFPQFPVMPGVLVIEAMSQLGSWLLAVSTDFKYKALLSSVKLAKFKRFIQPGDSLLLEVILSSRTEEIAALKGTGKVNGKTVAIVEFEVRLFPLEKLEHPQEAMGFYKLLSSDYGEIIKANKRERKSQQEKSNKSTQGE